MLSAVLLATPFVLLATTRLAFKTLGQRFGPRLGYFLGFIFYWLVWCTFLPLWSLGTAGVVSLFRLGELPFGRPAWLGVVLLAAPLALGYGYAFPRAVRGATASIVVASFALAVVNAFAEEVLWRGMYVSTFEGSVLLAVVFPAIGFGIWHLAPQVVHPNRNPGGAWSFVAVSILLGLMWGWVAFSTGSILLTFVSHVLFDFSGLGARLYLPSKKVGGAMAGSV